MARYITPTAIIVANAKYGRNFRIVSNIKNVQFRPNIEFLFHICICQIKMIATSAE